jgi:signal transduction histidine kinase
MRLRRRDVAALVLALVAAVSGLAAWVTGTVNLGLTLGTDESGFVRVVAVDWESIAWRNGIHPGDLVTGLEAAGDAAPALRSVPEAGSSAQIQIPTEPLPEPLIASVQTGYLDENGAVSCCGGSLARSDALLQLADGGWLLFLGLVAGALTLYAVAFGALGPRWQPEATPLAVAVAVPFMMAPVLYTGTAIGFAASCVLPAVAALPVARSLADLHPEDRWPRALFGTALVLAGAVALLTVRSLTGSAASMDRTELFMLMAGVAAVPALASALAGERAVAQRVEMVAIGVTPAAAMTVLQSYYAETFPLALVWLAGLLAWRKLPTAWVGRGVDAGRAALAAVGSLLSPEASARVPTTRPPVDPHVAASEANFRDRAALFVAGATALTAVAAFGNTWSLIIGAGLGSLVAVALRRGFLGAAWTDAAVPVGCAVAIPIMALAISSGGGTATALQVLLPTLGALPVAHLLASRHPDPAFARPLFVISCVVAGIVVLLTIRDGSEYGFVGGQMERYLLMGMVALTPGVASVLRAQTDASGQTTDRFGALAVALTPGAAMTVLVSSLSFVPLAAWLIALVAWQRMTITPLLGLALRTQRQRDLAVAAAEAERARLAADLHDDALQELTNLVRRLDAAGDSEGAELARGVAERLRAICSDLRLPLLDDLGAGPALEWLVSRVRPLANGDVRLERTDPQRPPAGVELAVFRVAQEALANAVRHGRPPITVRYHVDDVGGVSLSVDDAGPGIDPRAAEHALKAGHLGVANMQQRAEQIGALLDIRRWPAGGTHVALQWRPR